MSRKVIMLAYFAPPAAIGVRRLVSLLDYLPENGWDPVLVTCKPTVGEGHDLGPLSRKNVSQVPVFPAESIDPYRLMKRLKPDRAAVRPSSEQAQSNGNAKAFLKFLRRWVFLPDDRMGWIPFAAFKAVSLIRSNPGSLLYSSNYPQSSHVAALIAHRLTGAPWLADFRDGWTQNPAFYDPANRLIARLQHSLERAVVRRASEVVTVSPPITRYLQKKRPLSLPPVRTIWNGFDPVDFGAAEPKKQNHQKIKILYSGTLFGGRSASSFLQGVARLLREDPELGKNLNVQFRCALDEDSADVLKRESLSEVVSELPSVSFEQIIQEQRQADGCLLLLERGPGCEIMVSQKVFEYLASGTPIYAHIPRGAAQELLEYTGGATIEASESASDIAQSLKNFIDHLMSGTHPTPAPERLERFERKRQARQMARLLDRGARSNKCSR